MVKALCYKSEGRWFDSRWCRWNFSLAQNSSDRSMAGGSTRPLAEAGVLPAEWPRGFHEVKDPRLHDDTGWW